MGNAPHNGVVAALMVDVGKVVLYLASDEAFGLCNSLDSYGWLASWTSVYVLSKILIRALGNLR